MPRVEPASAGLAPAAVWETGDWVRQIAWTPDGTSVAAACADGRVVRAPADRDGSLTVLHEHAAGAIAVAVSCDGVVASGGEDGRLVIDGVVRDEGSGWVEHLAWRPDGRTLAASRRREVSFWSSDGAKVAAAEALPATVACLGWHPRGVTLAAGSYGGVRLLRGRDGHETDRLDWTGSVLTLAFSPDGKRLAHGNQDASVHFWDLRRGEELEMTGYARKVRQVAWSPDGRWLATGGGPVVTVWDFAGSGPAGSRPRELEFHARRVSALAFPAQGGLLASAGEDGAVVLWNPAEGHGPIAALEAGAPVTSLAWSAAGTRVAVATAGGSVAVLDCWAADGAT